MAKAKLRGFLFDMDGVLYRGARPLPGAREMLEELDRRGIPYALVTNNSTRTPRQYAIHMRKLGMRVPEDRIVTSAAGVVSHLKGTLTPGDRVLIVGEKPLRRLVTRAGFVPAWKGVKAVIVGLDRGLTFRKLSYATEALVGGAAFVASNPDPLLPTESSALPGAGAVVAALSYATGREPVVIGKPNPALLREAMRRTGTRPAETAMVGDQLGTDIAAGAAAGLFTVLVKTGVVAYRRRRGDPRPDLTVANMEELRKWLEARL